MKQYMTKYRFLFMGLGAAFLFTACGDDDEIVDNGPKPLVLEAYSYTYNVGEEPAIWANTKDPVGIYVMDSATDGVVAPHANIPYLGIGSSRQAYLVPVDNATIPYFAENGADRDVAAYFPYSEDNNGHVTLDVSKQGLINLRTFLFSRVNGLSAASPKATLELRPVFANLVFHFHAGGNLKMAQLDDMKLTLSGIPSTGDFDIARSTLTIGAERLPKVGVTVKIPTAPADAPAPGVTREAYISEAYLLPVLSTEGYRAVITLAGDNAPEYTVDLSKYTSLLSSAMKYEFTVVVTEKSATCTMVNGPIGDWNTGGEDLDFEIEEPIENL